MFTPKGLAKQTAKETGKAVVEDYRNKTTRNGIICNEANMPSTSNCINNVDYGHFNGGTSVVSSTQTPLQSPAESENYLPRKE